MSPCWPAAWSLLLLALAAHAAAPPPRRDSYGDPIPSGARLRLGTIRFRTVGHRSPVPLVLSHDGRRFACSATCGAVRVCSTATGKDLLRLASEDIWLDPAAFSGDDRLLAAFGEDGRVRVFDLATGRLHRTIFVAQPGKDPAERGGCVAFPAGGKTLAVWSHRGRLVLRDLHTGKVLRDERFSTFDALAGFSPDGQTLAVLVARNRLRLQPVGGGRPLFVDLPGETPPWGLSWSPEGRLLGVIGVGSTIVLVDASTGKCRWQSALAAGFAWQTAFSPDGRTLAVAADEELALLDVASGRRTRSLKIGCEHAEGICYRDAGHLWLVDQAGLIVTIDVRTGQPLPQPIGDRSPPDSLVFSQDGRTLATFGWRNPVNIWDTRTGRRLGAAHLPDPDSDVRRWTVRFLPAGRTAAAYNGATNQLLTLELPGGRVTGRLGKTATPVAGLPLGAGLSAASLRPRSLAVSPDGRLAAVGVGRPGADEPLPTVEVYQLSTGKKGCTLVNPGHGPIALSARGDFLAIGGEKAGRMQVRLFDPLSGEPRLTLSSSAAAPARILFSQDDRLVVALAERQVCVWERLTGRAVAEVTLPPELQHWEEAVLTLDHRLVLAGFRGEDTPWGDRRIFPVVWDVGQRRFLWTLTRPEDWRAQALSPDARTLALALADTTILLHDIPHPTEAPSGPLPPRKVQTLWSDLASRDAARAWRAVRTLAGHPGQALPLLRARLKPSASRLPRRLLAELDSDDFAVRQAATHKLSAALAGGHSGVEHALRKLLEGKPSLDTHHRIRRLLRPYNERPLPLTPDTLRAIRAIAVLERLGGEQALALLKKLAGGAADVQTREVRAALNRIRLQNRRR